MECKKEEAIRAKEIAEKKMQNKEFVGAQKIVLKAQQLYPNLENISQMMTVCEVHCSAENKLLGTEMDCYGILQIDQTADEASMKKQYRKLALLLHPDKNKFPGAYAAYKLICKAHRLLSDPAKRAVFDAKYRASLRTGPQRQSQPQLRRNNYVKKQPGVHANFETNAPTQFTSMNPHQVKQQAQPGFPNEQQTFWTVCPFCSIKYQYYRDIVNRALRCQSCAKPFVAYDLEAQGVPSVPNNRPTPQQKQAPNQGGQKKGTESTAGNFPSSMKFQGNLGYKQARSDSPPSRKTGGTSEVGGASKTKKEEDGNVHMKDVKEGKDMPKSEAGNFTEQKSSGSKNRKIRRDSGETSESCDTGSSMDSEEDEVLEENGVHPTGSTGDHYVRMSCLQKQLVKYNEESSDDDDTVNRAKRAKVNGSPEASRKQSGSILKGEAKTDPIGCSTVFGEEKKVEKQKERAPLEESLPNGNDEAETCKNNGKKTAAMDDKKEGSRVDNESESNHENKSDPDVFVVPFPEFFDFDKDKEEECFAVDQMWAIYDDLDGMPRSYVRIRKVYSPFKVGIIWLEAGPEVQDEIDWFQEELPVACGKFKNEKTGFIDEISAFSHRVDWEKGTSRGSYKIYPRRGETWALFKNWNIHWSSDPDNHINYEYEFVEVLSDFTPESGIRVGYLVKLKGFVSLFKPIMKNEMASFEIPKNELFRFSHRVPSLRTSGTEREDVPKGYWELDPASLPDKLEEFCDPAEVKVNIESVDVQINGSSKSPSTKSGNSTPRKSNRCHKKPNEENVNHYKDKTSTGPDLVKERRLENKIALITGAASGIGKATAREFIKHGAKVIIADIQNQLGQETASELGPNATFIHCNVVKESDVSAAVDFAVSKHGHLDIMYNNAGISGKTPPSILDLNLEDFDRVMNINVRGVLTGIKHASRVMIPRRTGSILCTASVTGVIGGLAPHAYSISKSTVVGMVRSMASELCKYGVRVNCISPFAVPTPFVMDDMVNLFPGVEASCLVETVHSAGALKGANCEAIDVAIAAVYLASDEAKFVNGHNLVVDGGFSSFKNLELKIPDKMNYCEDKTSTGPDLVKERRNAGPTSDKESESTCQVDAKKMDSKDSKHASPNKVAGDQIPVSPSCPGPSEIPDTKFHDFGIDKSHEKFQPGQIWAVYCDLDALPKFYAQLTKVELSPDFKLHARWLDYCRSRRCIQWFDNEMPVSCGMFKLNEMQTFTYAHSFSHQLRIESARKKSTFEIYPRKGEVWAIYKNSNPKWTHSDLQNCEYDIVEILAHDSSKTKVMVLEKVTGFGTVFKAKKKLGHEFVTDIPRPDLITTFSHQIPAFWLAEERNGSLRDCWELDNNSMPACLLP